MVGLSCCPVWSPPVGVCYLCGLTSFVVSPLSFFGLLSFGTLLMFFGSCTGRAVVF